MAPSIWNRSPLDFGRWQSKAVAMDMGGSLRAPDRCWIEFRDLDGALLTGVLADDDGTRVYAELPVFERGTIGTQQICRETDGEVWREEPEDPGPLPDRLGLLFICQYG